MGTARKSKARKARLKKGFPLSTGKTPKEPPKTHRPKTEHEKRLEKKPSRKRGKT